MAEEATDNKYDDWLDETSYEVGQAMGSHEAYEQVRLAYEAEGEAGVVRWLDAMKPKTEEGWREYEKNHAGETFPWESPKE